MAARTAISAASLASLIAVSWIAASTTAFAGGGAVIGEPQAQQVKIVASDTGSRSLKLGKGKSIVVQLPRDIKDVVVGDPDIANVVVRSARRAYIIARSQGATNIFFFDAQGKQIAGFDIAVQTPLDVNVIREAIHKVIPDGDVNVESVGDGLILTGTVANQVEAQEAYEIATRFAEMGNFSSQSSTTNAQPSGGGSAQASASTGSNSASGQGNAAGSGKVINALIVRGRDEVMLKVTVAEIDRNIVKQLGINLSGSLGYGSTVLKLNTNNPFPINGSPTDSLTGTFPSVTATLQAMDQAGVVRTLAEPTLTAISGESAHFLAGGMFPYPSVNSCQTPPCPPTIQFQDFGVSLTFTPVVLSGGRISLHMLTEVSQLSQQNSVTVAGTSVPGLDVRRTDTTVEIPSGGSLAIAGMLQQQTKQEITGFPGLMTLPVLGPLFKSRDYLNNLTDLAVIVTPYIVHAVAAKDLSRPDDGFADPSDPSAVLLNHLNRLYGVGGAVAPPPGSYHGNFGFILD
jgi:pilus assembly protein CpaC